MEHTFSSEYLGIIASSSSAGIYNYSSDILVDYLVNLSKSFEEIALADMSEYLNVPELLIKFVISEVILKNLNYKIKGDMLIFRDDLSSSRITQINNWSSIPTEHYTMADITVSSAFSTSTTNNQSVSTQTFGEYTIRRVLGQDDYRTVFQARYLNGRKVAIKVMNAFSDKKMLRRFVREIGFWKMLRHLNIVCLLDYSIEPQVYLVMELMDGDLRSNMKNSIDFDEIIDIILQVAMGLEYAHNELQFIHRDIKPENILFRNITYELTDWGLAKLTGSETRSGYSGSISYSAPEQFYPEFGEIGPWTDVWQLGVVFYELFTSELPFGRDLSEVIRRVKSEDPVIPTSIDLRVQNLLKSMLAKQPQNQAKLKDIIKVLNTFLFFIFIKAK